ncbi:hypothetical protein HUB98_03705 [Paenibacillus barcinonensis]|uniref:Uncharacterized protein n=3 Tax=Paenibacillus barcinonensis TaxID=198119 RepID=A0ABX6Q0I6_PAEBA|nr:hypothetical protein [Paenibacillus barcinonensis]QKS55506.1 hypothetical protein HUB98_03705 [Paenibacillus barcinonensis]
MGERLTTSIVLYGQIEPNDIKQWNDFYLFSKEIITSLNFKPNYIGISGDSFQDSKLRTLVRTEKKLLKSFEKEEYIEALEVYALPQDFTIAAFDYNVYIARSKQVEFDHILATFTSEVFKDLDQERLVDLLKRFIVFKSGEIFQLSNLESPQIYASKANALTAFKTLSILKEITK